MYGGESDAFYCRNLAPENIFDFIRIKYIKMIRIRAGKERFYALRVTELVNTYFFAPVLPVLLFAAGIYFMIVLRGFLIFHPIKILRSLFKKRKSGQSPFKAAMLALAGTLGVGNIAGVATAITAGGAGAVFWMWVSSVAAMLVKYAEIVLAMHYKTRKDGAVKGGAAFYMEAGLKSRRIAVLFSVLCLFASFSIGNTVQSYAASDAMKCVLGIPKPVTGIVIAAVSAVVILGGLKRISDFTMSVVPILSAGYIILSLAVIISNIDMMPEIIRGIVNSAFNIKSAAGGAAGYGIAALMRSKPLRYGISRGLISNEAGCGTAPTAHVSSDSENPVEQGFWGIFEVFADTVLLCSLTAFVILIALGKCGGSLDGTELAIYSFGVLAGDAAGIFIGVSVLIYAIASIICWSYYGFESLDYLGLSGAKRWYIILYCLAGIAGSVLVPSVIWDLADLSIAAMAIVNTLCVLKLSKTVIRLTGDYFRRI